MIGRSIYDTQLFSIKHNYICTGIEKIALFGVSYAISELLFYFYNICSIKRYLFLLRLIHWESFILLQNVEESNNTILVLLYFLIRAILNWQTKYNQGWIKLLAAAINKLFWIIFQIEFSLLLSGNNCIILWEKIELPTNFRE